MPFQFQCPRGHLLEADQSQVAQPCQCPTCGERFAIPAPSGMEAFAGGLNFAGGPTAAPEASPFTRTAGAAPFAPPSQQASESRMLHIPCPQGHELEVPPEMLGQHVMCPHCQSQFRLRDEDSIEYKRQRQRKQELEEYRTGKAWFTWAVVVAVLVVLGLIAMIVASASQ